MKPQARSPIPVKIPALILAVCFFSFTAHAGTKLLKLKIAKANYSDEIVIRFMEGATVGFDGCCDAWKLFSGNSSVPNLYTKIQGGELSINSLPPLVAPAEINLFVRTGESATYSITPTQVDSFPANTVIILIDNVTGASYDLATANKTHVLNLPVIRLTDPARFLIGIIPSTILPVEPVVLTSDSEINVYPVISTGIFFISGDIDGGEAKIVSMEGREVLSQHFSTESEKIDMLGRPNGIYFLNILKNGDVLTKKIVIHN